MEPESLLPCSQQPSTGPYFELDQSSPYHPILSPIHLNIILPPTSRSFYWSLSFWLSHQNPLHISLLPMRATCPFHLILLDMITLIIYFAKSISYEAPHYVVFSNLPPFHPSSVQFIYLHRSLFYDAVST
jgi:hypothetical protein